MKHLWETSRNIEIRRDSGTAVIKYYTNVT